MDHGGGCKLRTMTLLVVIGCCGTLLFLSDQTTKLRPSKEEKTFSEGWYRIQQHVKLASKEPNLNVSLSVPVISAKSPRWETLTSEETTKPDPPVHRVPLSGRGYVVALRIWEQMLAASRDLLHMQCWASTLGPGISVVQPFLLTNLSRLGFSFASDSTNVSELDLSTLYDMTTWAQQWTEASSLAPLVSREDVVSEISKFEKSVILVQVKYLSLSRDAKCVFSWNVNDVMKDLKWHQNLRVARHICVNLQRKISPSMFRSLVFGHLAPQDSLIIFKEWRGLGQGRVYVHLPSCSKKPDYHHLHLSDQVWKDAENYVNMYLEGIGHFISISARFEKMLKKHASMTLEQRQRDTAALIPQALSDVRKLQGKYGMTKVHLSYDYGKFGSGSFMYHNYYRSEHMLVKFQNDLYNGTVSFAEYEESYGALSSTNPAYVALVQMAVSSMAFYHIMMQGGLTLGDLNTDQAVRTVPHIKVPPALQNEAYLL